MIQTIILRLSVFYWPKLEEVSEIRASRATELIGSIDARIRSSLRSMNSVVAVKEFNYDWLTARPFSLHIARVSHIVAASRNKWVVLWKGEPGLKRGLYRRWRPFRVINSGICVVDSLPKRSYDVSTMPIINLTYTCPFRPRPLPGFCPWAPLGAFRPLDPFAHSTSKPWLPHCCGVSTASATRLVGCCCDVSRYLRVVAVEGYFSRMYTQLFRDCRLRCPLTGSSFRPPSVDSRRRIGIIGLRGPHSYS